MPFQRQSVRIQLGFKKRRSTLSSGK